MTVDLFEKGADLLKLRKLAASIIHHKRYESKFFDKEFYKKIYSPLLPPLVDYLVNNPLRDKKPTPWFDPIYYLKEYPGVRESRMDPFFHFVNHGFFEMKRTARDKNFRDIMQWLFKKGKLSTGTHEIPLMQSVRRLEAQSDLDVLCVCSETQLEFIKCVTAKSFEDCGYKIRINLYIYDALVENRSTFAISPKVEMIIYESIGNIGFGAGINYLFKKVVPNNYFLVMNPDSFPQPSCIRNLVNRIVGNQVGIVEARQWPNSHPKESDPITGATPWASGAFFLVRSDLFEHIEGFDESFFLYTEDVDLSWKTWLSGLKVVEEREAICEHHTGTCWYMNDVIYGETFYSARNFIALLKKYFGEEGKKVGISTIKHLPWSDKLKMDVINSYSTIDDQVKEISWDFNHPMIKIIGYNQYHEFDKNN